MADQLALKDPTTNKAVATIDGMVSEVAGLVGGEDNINVKAKAIKALDRAADVLNMSGLYLFRRKEVTYSNAAAGGSGSTLLALGDKELTTPSDWGWPDPSVMAVDSDGNERGEIFWQSWETFRRMATRDTSNANSTPAWIAIRNEMEEVLHIWPPIDTEVIAQIIVPYFARILRPSEVGDSNLYASQEAIEAMIMGGEAYMMRFRHKNQPQMWLPFWKLFEKTVLLARSAAHRNQQVLDTWAFPGETGYDNQAGNPNSRLLVIDLGI